MEERLYTRRGAQGRAGGVKPRSKTSLLGGKVVLALGEGRGYHGRYREQTFEEGRHPGKEKGDSR